MTFPDADTMNAGAISDETLLSIALRLSIVEIEDAGGRGMLN
jgi:hypothetical protein